jgi:predicted PurR-regulated permease PerM
MRGTLFVVSSILINFTVLIQQGEAYIPSFQPRIYSSTHLTQLKTLSFTKNYAATHDNLTSSKTSVVAEISKILDSKLLKHEFLEKFLSWSLFGIFASVLQPFYGIVLGTFFLAYLGNSVVASLKSLSDRVSERFNLKIDIPRRVFAFIHMLAFIIGIARFVILVFPKIGFEAQYFLSIVQSENPYREASDAMRKSFGDVTLARIENILLAFLGDNGRKFAGYDSKVADQTLRFGKLLQYAMKG